MEYGGQLSAGFKQRESRGEGTGQICFDKGHICVLIKVRKLGDGSLLGDFGVRLIASTFIFVGSC